MKHIFLLVILSFIGEILISQEEQYLTEKNIFYYTNQDAETDNYTRQRCILDIYYPKERSGFATIIWFHGGGLTAGDKELPEALKEKGFCVVGAGYRLSPQVNSPKYIEDAAAAVSWVFNNISKYGGDPNLIFVAGHSAGAYLTCMIGLDKQWLNKYQINANRIAGLFALSSQTITHSTIRKERGIEANRPIIDELAPLYYVRSDAPPLWLITGDRELEMPGRYEENAYLMRMMKVNGHKETKLYELGGYGHNMTEPAFPLLVQEIQLKTKEKKKLQDSSISISVNDKVIILQPDGKEGIDATIEYWPGDNYPNRNWGNSELFGAIAWTAGEPLVVRSLIKFDLRKIKPKTRIKKASLSLYAGNVQGSGNGHSDMSGSNEFVLTRIISPWKENVVTWNTQPGIDSVNGVKLPASDFEMQDYLDIDLTEIIQDMINNPSRNFGFMIKLLNEEYYRRVIFGSSDYRDASKRPKLVIEL